MRLSAGRCRGVLHTPLSSGSLKKRKDAPSKRKKTQLLLTLLPLIYAFHLNAYGCIFFLNINNPKPQANGRFHRRNPKASGKRSNHFGETNLPQAKWCFRLETSNCLRQNGIFSWKQQIASGKTTFPARNNDLPKALASRRWKYSFA